MERGLPLGEFTCPITFEIIRPPKPVVKEEDGVTYVVQGDYEIAFQTVLRFTSGMELPFSEKTVRRSSFVTPPASPPR